jgi:hypothetical protein
MPQSQLHISLQTDQCFHLSFPEYSVSRRQNPARFGGSALHHLHFNHWALLVSALILWFLGAIWYSPALFAKPWMAILKIDPANKNNKSMIIGMISSFIGDLLLSLVLAHMVLWSGTESYCGGALIGFIVWLGFFAAPNFPQGIYEGRPFKLFAINMGYWLVGLLIVGGLLAVWR